MAISEKLDSGSSAKFAAVGDTHKIRITDIDKRPGTKPGGEPDLNKNGTQVDEYLIDGITDSGDEMRIYAKRGMWFAILEAFRAAGLSNTAECVGGTLAVKYVGDEPSEVAGFRPKKVYQAAFQPAPEKTSLIEDLL